MPELIDRQALIADYRICGGCSSFENCSGHIMMCDSARVRQAINEAPKVEAEPVRRGRWITIFPDTAKCLCCGWWQRTTMYNLPDDISAFSECYRFCTSCGARMDATDTNVGGKGGADND